MALAVVAEALVLHLWLATRHPRWAWAVTALSAATLVYLALEYRAWGTGAIHLTPDALDVRIAGRIALRVPRASVASVVVASWRELPDGPLAGYLNATGPAEPNVVLTFTVPVRAQLAAGLVSRQVERLGLHVDDPVRFVAALTPAPAH
jgi:hypothetical protein